MKHIKIHMLHEQGESFIDIAKKFGLSAKEAMQSWIKVEKARDLFKSEPIIVYRKRLNPKTNKSKFIEKMRSL
ncbi:hypothetical protein AVV36_gp247 [Pectobacterium bacteriophage PM2]|uniref:Uncharacterized protein n=1 Tax=Pectobacterium bacteriophage PM2 TaxID=1429794 RepID=A0A0A0Q0U1_9CAUD|nr:hypothetical protein AVV36_gp247 [Pectobacterium bacteriophage PM2]AHY25163.1 hypothetical protein PM2_201 [Pectobacterium bacteriophage PM2]